jgi:hypothetical protein
VHRLLARPSTSAKKARLPGPPLSPSLPPSLLVAIEQLVVLVVVLAVVVAPQGLLVVLLLVFSLAPALALLPGALLGASLLLLQLLGGHMRRRQHSAPALALDLLLDPTSSIPLKTGRASCRA